MFECKIVDDEGYERNVSALTPQYAAEQFVRQMEWDQAAFPVATGNKIAIVTVDGVRYEVKGITDPQYEASKL